jgi:hypothetical protein
MYIQLPLDILRYILFFFEEWRIIGDKFVHIAKLTRIAHPVFSRYSIYSTVTLIFRNNPDKGYRLGFTDIDKKFTVVFWSNPEVHNTRFFLSITRMNWVQLRNKDLLIWS